MNAPLPAMATRVAAVSPAPVVYLHFALFLADGRTLADETFRLVSFQGKETVSEPFEFQLELHGNTSGSEGATLKFDDVVGRPLTVGVHYPALDASGQPPSREQANQWFQDALAGQDESTRLAFFNGIAASFAMAEPGVYRITLRPALWKLTLTNAYRVHRAKNVREVIDSLLKQHRLDFSVDALVGSDNIAATRRQDWLQAGESDYDFLQRLMSKAHIYYFFKTKARSHTVVFANRPAYPNAVPGDKPLRYTSTSADELGLAQPDVLTEYSFQQSLTATAVEAVFTREQAAWEVDPVAGFHSWRTKTRDDPGELPFRQYQIYTYGGSDSEVDHYADNTQAAIDASGREFSGACHSPWLRCGHQFGVTALPRAQQQPPQVQPALEGLRFVATQVEHQATLDGGYSNTFRSTDAAGLLTPFSPQDTQQGSVLAVVVGHAPASWKWYRKSDFDPVTEAMTDSDSSEGTLQAQGVCVRFSSDPDDAPGVWVKLPQHMQTAPEIGAMVLVARAQDQSELPEIQSIVAGDGNIVVKPDGWTANTTVGSSYATTYGDSQSVRFGLKSQADLDRATGIVSGQYASGKFREVSYAQGASYSYATSEQGPSGLLTQSDSFGSTYSTHHGAVSSSETVFDTMVNQSTVNQNSTNEQVVGGNSTNTNVVHGNSVNDSTVGGDANSTNVVSGTSSTTNRINIQEELSLSTVSKRTSITGDAANVQISGLTQDVSIKGATISVDIAGPGISAKYAGSQIVMELVDLSTTIVDLKIYI